MRRQRIYISGPISDRPLAEACEHFSKAEAELRRHGFRTVNPLKMRMAEWLARHGCYRLCLLIELAWMAYTCPVVYMLENWQQSGGARTEKALATALGKRILYENYVPKAERERTKKQHRKH